MSGAEAESEETRLLRQAASGDTAALGALFAAHRERLERMIRLRLDQRVQGRVNPSDVIQETCLEAGRRLSDYLKHPDVPFFVWLRFLARQRLVQVHRHHLGRQARDVRREVPADQPDDPNSSDSGVLAFRLAEQSPSASTILQREELRRRLQELLDSLKPVDREILILRHFEHLSNSECASVLDLTETAARNRYVRALERLRAAIGDESEFR